MSRNGKGGKVLGVRVVVGGDDDEECDIGGFTYFYYLYVYLQTPDSDSRFKSLKNSLKPIINMTEISQSPSSHICIPKQKSVFTSRYSNSLNLWNPLNQPLLHHTKFSLNTPRKKS